MFYNLFYFHLYEEMVLLFLSFWCLLDTYFKFMSRDRMVNGKELGAVLFGLLTISLVCGCFMSNSVAENVLVSSKIGFWFKLVTVLYMLFLNLLVPDELSHWGVLNLGILASLFLIISISNWLICWFILEWLGLCFYVIIVLGSSQISRIEGSLKYLIFNKIGSGFIYVSCVIFWLSLDGGWFKFLEVSFDYFNFNVLTIFGIVLLILGIAIKLGLFPFMFWLVDSYESASVLGLALLTVVGKIAILVFGWKVFLGVFLFDVGRFCLILFSVLCIMVSSILGLSQVRLGRFWVYSSLVNVSYILLSLISFSITGELTLLIYVAYYSIISLGVYSIWFIVISQLSTRQFVSILDLVKFSSSSCREGILFWLSLLSIAGMPPLVGFFLKFCIILSLIQTGQWVMAIVCIFSGVLTFAFYLNCFIGFFFGKFWSVGLYPRPSWRDHYLLAFLLILNIVFILNVDTLVLFLIDLLL